MKTTRITRFSLFVLVAVLPQFMLAQSTKTYKESFDVNDDAVVKLAVSNSKIKIDTWNKNKVEVKTILKTKNDSEQDLDALFEAWKISALGNSERVEIKDHSSGENVMVFSNVPRPQQPPMPPRPPRPTKPTQPPNLPNIDFDYEAFEEEGKAYLEKFRKQLDSSDFRKKIRIWGEAFRDSIGMHRDSLQKYRHELREHRETIRGYAKQIKDEMAPLIEKMKARVKSEVMENPDFNNVERIIEIKIPKSAKLEVDIKHSEMDISSVYEIDANLNYSGLQIDAVDGDFSEIALRYSKLNIGEINELNLIMNYSKDVVLKSVENLHADAKMSELHIENLSRQAIINGSYGKLNIELIQNNFELLDIKLKNSEANLKLPQTKFRFYAKTASSNFNLNSEFDYSLQKSFDHTIYQNSKATNSSKLINITADYSKVNLN